MEKLTLAKLKEMEPGAIFALGKTTNDEKGVYMTETRKGDLIRWIAKRGQGEDWCIYCAWAEWPVEEIARTGQKVVIKENILKLVPCDDQALALYRH